MNGNFVYLLLSRQGRREEQQEAIQDPCDGSSSASNHHDARHLLQPHVGPVLAHRGH